MNRLFASLYGLIVLASALPALAAAHPTPTPSPTAMPAMSSPTPAPATSATPISLGIPTTLTTYPPDTSGRYGIPYTSSPVPLSLQDAKMIAVKQSPQLALARAAADLAGAQLETANSAAFPQITGAGTFQRSRGQSRSGTTVGAFAPNIFTSNSVSATVHQLIFDGGATYARMSQAKWSRDASELNSLRQVDVVLFDVAQLYYAALQARYTYQVAIANTKLAQVQEQLVEAQYRAGVASHADVLTAQLPVAQAQLAEAQAANGESSEIAALLNAMGLPSDTPVTLSDTFAQTAPPLPAYASVEATAQTHRYDLASAQAALTSAERGVRAARASRYPIITGFASIGSATGGVDAAGNIVNNGGSWVSTYSFGADVSMPLYDSGLTNGQIAAAEANSETALGNLNATALGVSLNVRQAYLSAQTALAQVASARTELDQAQTVLDVTNAQYKAGVTTLVLLLNAQVGLTKARGDYVNALFGLYTAEQNLYFAEGIIAGR
ncbi:MAG: TolC family protein [Candidatus Eremiobacteraeota bacterium]|nr:TolC family protein [Candidatus Eremiobacteraeota bacterium]MBV8367274.1 TolC family protein [Candidatus Eremiobacteraeota bacterium]